MLRWCAYCQRYLGEKEPFEDYSLTHGICQDCLQQRSYSNDEAIERTRPLASFYGDLMTMARSGHHVPVDDVVRRGRALGVRPTDLLVGLLQPALYEVGREWERGALTPAREAAFSRFCDGVMRQLTAEQGARLPPPSGPVLLLMNARHNHHTIGLRMAAFLMRERGLDVQALVPTPPTDELAAELVTRCPALLGVSLATPWQRDFLDELLTLTLHLSPRPRLVAGGAAVRAGVTLPEGVEAWTHLDEMLASLQTPATT